MDTEQCSEPGIGLTFVLLIYIGFPAFLLFSTWLLHWLIRRSRQRYLADQEAHFAQTIRLSNLKRFPPKGCGNATLVTGSAAIANNYFVAYLAGFKNIFGGEIKGYTKLCDDARRLALVRLLQDAEQNAANAVYNVRFETATIVSAANNKQQAGGVEIIAYGTAVKEHATAE